MCIHRPIQQINAIERPDEKGQTRQSILEQDKDRSYSILVEVRVMVFSDTFNNISVILWRSVLLLEETSHNVVLSTPRMSGI
jgi:hypothetical protein